MSEVVMPRLSDTMEEGELSKWLKDVGDPVAKGDTLAEIETDKATMDLEAFESGVLEQQLVEAGAVVPIGTPVAVIGDGSGAKKADAAPSSGKEAASQKNSAAAEPADGGSAEPAEKAPAEAADNDEAPAEAADNNEAPAEAEAKPKSPVGGDSESAAESDADADAAAATPAKLRTSPLARKIAREHGIELADITGTGPQGRIVRADVEAAIEAGPAASSAPGASTAAATPAATAAAPAAASATPAAAAPSEADEEVPVNRIRMVAAKRLTESQAVPHFFLTSVVDVEKLLAFRAEANEALATQGVKMSVNDVLVRAAAVALREHPEANSSWGGDKLLRHAHVNIGIAVATDAGLLVPVIRDADRKGLGEIATESVALAAKARDGKLSIDEMTGGTFSVSNLGMFGIDQFTAVINPPEAAILAVGAASPVPVLRDGVLVDVPKLKITLTVDHRVMDGAVAAGFLRDLVGILEQPLRLVL